MELKKGYIFKTNEGYLGVIKKVGDGFGDNVLGEIDFGNRKLDFWYFKNGKSNLNHRGNTDYDMSEIYTPEEFPEYYV